MTTPEQPTPPEQGRWHLTPAGTFCKCADGEHLYYEDALGIDDLNALEADLARLRTELNEAKERGDRLAMQLANDWKASVDAVNEADVVVKALRTENERQEGAIEKLKNLIDAHSWLAEGRGPYASEDGHYDEEVQRFVRSLLENLDPGRWEPWQTVLTENETLRTRAEQAEAFVREFVYGKGDLVRWFKPMREWLDALTEQAKS